MATLALSLQRHDTRHLERLPAVRNGHVKAISQCPRHPQYKRRQQQLAERQQRQQQRHANSRKEQLTKKGSAHTWNVFPLLVGPIWKMMVRCMARALGYQLPGDVMSAACASLQPPPPYTAPG